MIAFLFFSHFWQAVEEIMENVLATFNLQPSFFSKVRQYPCTFLPLHMPKTDAVIMIWSLKVHYMYNQLGTQDCCFFLTPPPFPTLTILCVLLVRVSKHLMQPNNLVSGCCLFDTPTIFLCALLVWGLKKIDTTVGKIDTDDIIN